LFKLVGLLLLLAAIFAIASRALEYSNARSLAVGGGVGLIALVALVATLLISGDR